ncbi:helix-turn-helix transcriptional regulator [Actinomadura sp. HBU206391]|uniref:helix-turn-helix transcriptional regulator n=1 Tax=Actinomadura sp. HBU206391 TaxID=2731692 RepID=UPI0016505B56|nr:helix-turn-helix transcriptional regulator [Actinomadura sp. HBU206391]MBC6463788.1 helix-turn-helix transcriptional regulator [Actinomadura sp. HBU206391]
MTTAPTARPARKERYRAPDTALLRRLRLAKDTMDREWSGPLDMDAVAAVAGYSTYHFVRRFRDVYGETPGQYLSRRRIERAKELLRSANLTVTEICMLVGFSSLGTFCTRFKQQVGMTPGQYRDSARTSASAHIPGCFVLFWAGGFRPNVSKNREGGPEHHHLT